MKILVFENSNLVNSLITRQLKLKGHKVDSFTQIEEIINNLDNGYACYILGIDSNVTKSLDVLKMIRDFHLEPNIIMININDEIDASFIKKVYDHGCDEFLKKPFFLDELVIKIEKLCKVRNDMIFFSPKCSFSFQTGIFQVENSKKKLSRKETLLFSLLLNNQDHIVSYEAIKMYVWDGQDIPLESIRSLIRRLRKRLSLNSIETVMDVGYILRYDALLRDIELWSWLSANFEKTAS